MFRFFLLLFLCLTNFTPCGRSVPPAEHWNTNRLKKVLNLSLNVLQIPWPGKKKNINCFFIYNSPDLGWWGGFITGPQAVLVEDP